MHDSLAARLDDTTLADVLGLVPDEWLEPTQHLPDPGAVRTAYQDLLRARLSRPEAWVPGRRT